MLQQHCDFFDRDHDGILWPQDTFVGFRRLGFGIILSVFAVFVIHANFSYPTCSGWLPDPFFRLFLANIHKDKHGSDTGTYDHEGRYVPQKFEDIFAKYAQGRDYLTIWDLSNVLHGQRCIADPVGWGGALFECRFTPRRLLRFKPCADGLPRARYVSYAMACERAHDEGKLQTRSNRVEILIGNRKIFAVFTMEASSTHWLRDVQRVSRAASQFELLDDYVSRDTRSRDEAGSLGMIIHHP